MDVPVPGGRILALDPGEKRIGLAVSDELGMTAQGLPTLERRGGRHDMDHLAELIETHRIGRVVVGMPYREDGTLGPSAGRAMAFMAQLAKRTTVPVTSWDERLTTRMADQVLRESGLSGSKRRAHRDRLAAVIILQSYLDALRAGHAPPVPDPAAGRTGA